MNRWVFREWAYVRLMRDEYPPFRLDGGSTDPGSMPACPPTPHAPEAPAPDAHLVGAGGGEPPPPEDDR